MKIRSLALLLFVFVCSCKHTDTPTPDPVSFVYSVNYDPVISMQANSIAYFTFSIDVSSGDISQNKLTCAISNLPGNAAVAPASILVGQVKGGLFTFRTGDIPLGYDTLQFSLSGTANGTDARQLILHIIPPTDYAPQLVGVYANSYDFCAPVTFKHTSTVTSDSAYSLKITNLDAQGEGFVVKAKLSNVITIPYQVVMSRKIWGSGTFTKDPNSGNTRYRMAINDTIVAGMDTSTCVAHLEY